MRELLEGTVAVHLRSAAVLRANGRASDAARAEQFASRVRLRLDQPKVVKRMRDLIQDVHDAPHTALLLERALEGAISLLRADFGNVQLCGPASGSLRIATQCGFSREFLEYFAVVDDDDASACGRAANRHSQTVIADVKLDPEFAPHRDIAAASRFRGVQSTPVIDPAGRLRGVISTHFRSPHCPSVRDLMLMQWYAEDVGAELAKRAA